ncbi:reverse transcriptase domain-containing protein [Tanacetum coccineum]
MQSISRVPCQVEVFELSSGVWRIPCGNLPRKSVRFTWSQVVVDGFIYRYAFDRVTNIDDGGFQSYNLIMSFDMKSEDFKEIYLPERLTLNVDIDYPISKLRESLVVNPFYSIWMMEDDVSKSFTKLFTINTPGASIKTILGFRKNGDIIVETPIKHYEAALKVYEPSSVHINDLGIYREIGSFGVSSYMETLLLLDQVTNMDDDGFQSYNLIMSFDMKSEEFKEIYLPEILVLNVDINYPISKLRESLVMLEYNIDAENPVYGVWMMEDGVSKSFTKLFTIKHQCVNKDNTQIIRVHTGWRSLGSSLFIFGFILEVEVGSVYISPPPYLASAGLGMLLLVEYILATASCFVQTEKWHDNWSPIITLSLYATRFAEMLKDENAYKKRNQNQNRPHHCTATATTPITDATIRALIARGVADALVEQEIQRNTDLNGDGSQGSGSGITRPVRPTREMETVFHISNCAVKNQIKFATCTLLGAALTWWNSQVKIVGHDAAYGMPSKTLMKMMTVKYCPRSESKKLEIEIWNLKVKGTDVVGYTQRFQELALMCRRMFLEESDELEKYVGGLPDMIQAENKRKFDNNNQAQQQLAKRQNVAQAYTAGTGERKEYAGTLPLCNKCKFHHNGPCTAKTITCYECGNQGHYKSDCPELKNRNHGNQAKGTVARGMLYALGGGETNQHLDDMEDDINV